MASVFTAGVHNVISTRITKYLLPSSIGYSIECTDVSKGQTDFTIYSAGPDRIIPQLEDLFQSQEESLKLIHDCVSDPIRY
jgi:hypothetical protein